ncbi:MAG: methyltransferase type 11, partial [Rhodospirillales bacterium]
SMDRVLFVHALESAEQVRPMLREVWRVLAGSGRLIIIVPNRRGIWARFERTPFGHGQPYTLRQLSRLLRDNLFTPVQSSTALYIPPVRSRMVLSSATAWERLGHPAFSTFAGVIVSEAVKQIYTGQTEAAVTRQRNYLPVPERTPRTSTRG